MVKGTTATITIHTVPQLTKHFDVGVSPLVELGLEELCGALELRVLHPVRVDEVLEAVAERVGCQPVEHLGQNMRA